MTAGINRLQVNLENVRGRMAAACERSGRPRGDVTLVAVTKSVGPEVADALADLGVADIGENRVQDAIAKSREMNRTDAVRWHMIGHLQRNKVRRALELFGLIHSVDSVRLAAEIDRVAGPQGHVMPALLEVNVSGEERKFGLRPEETAEVIREISAMDHISVEGLMTMAPFGASEAELRRVFAGLRALSERIASLGIPRVRMQHLSMGMSQDFEIAIEEGATMVRVGSALFV